MLAEMTERIDEWTVLNITRLKKIPGEIIIIPRNFFNA